jgi:3-oxoacyl-(acyl-carrier-protein) synthase
MNSSRPRILITGMGAVSPFGTGVDALWEGLAAGRDGISDITRFDTSDYRVKAGGVVRDWKPDFPEDPSLAWCDLAIQFCARALREAIENARLTNDNLASPGCAIVLSTNFGQFDLYEAVLRAKAKGEAVESARLAESQLEYAPSRLAKVWGIGGPRALVSLSCSSGNAALSYAAQLIRAGRAEVVVTAGYDAISPFAWAGLLALRTMTTDKIRPFDKERSGTIFGEGAGAIILETEAHAAARGRSVAVELAGCHTNNNAFHLTAPDKDGAALVRAMRSALEDAGVAPEQVDHLNAHGTATRYNDKTETEAAKAVLGKHAYEIPINAVKSMVGHMMGAASAIEAIATARTIETGVVPPTINFRTPDPECDLNYCTSGKVLRDVRCAISNSSGLGGCNSVIVLRRA